MYVVYVLKVATIYLSLSDEGKMSNVNALKWQIPSSFGGGKIVLKMATNV